MARQSLTTADVLFRDEALLVLNKPAGVPVHGSRMLEGRPETLLAMARDLTGRMVHAVHRLDRPVSGAIMLAFDRETLASMGSEFENRRVKKQYLAVARGWPRESGVIDHPLAPPRDERRTGDGRRAAVTRFRRLGTAELSIPVPPYQTARYSLLTLSPETGRRHQLRRHMKHLSHHLVGDTTYGKGEHNRVFREHLDCERLLLHSLSLTFRHPVSGRQLAISAPLDAPFSRIVAIFGQAATAGLSTCPAHAE